MRLFSPLFLSLFFLFDHFPFGPPLKHRHPSNTTPKCLTRSISLALFWLVKAKRNYSGSGDVNTLSPPQFLLTSTSNDSPTIYLSSSSSPLKLLGGGGSLSGGINQLIVTSETSLSAIFILALFESVGNAFPPSSDTRVTNWEQNASKRPRDIGQLPVFLFFFCLCL